MKQSVFFVIVISLVISVIIATLMIVPEFGKMQCDKMGGDWSPYFNVGCKMEPEECRGVDGVPEECRQSVGLSCADVCHFR